MQRVCSLLFTFSVLLLNSTVLYAAEAAKPVFSSLYTDLNKDCRNAFPKKEIGEGQDMPLKCKGYGGYYIYIYFSAWTSELAVNSNDKKVSIPLASQDLGYPDDKGRKIEWRCADGRPFALIMRVTTYNEKAASADGENPKQKKYKTGELLRVVGLPGHENILHEVDTRAVQNPNDKARQLADQGYGE